MEPRSTLGVVKRDPRTNAQYVVVWEDEHKTKQRLAATSNDFAQGEYLAFRPTEARYRDDIPNDVLHALSKNDDS